MVNKGKFVASWSRQRKLKEIYKDEEVPDTDELVNIVSRIKITPSHFSDFYTKRARALFVMYYLTGCRVTEIVKCFHRTLKRRVFKRGTTKKGQKYILYDVDEKGRPKLNMEVVGHNFKGLTREDIKFKDIDNNRFMFIRTENRKNKSRKTKRPPIPIDLEAPLVKFLFDYLEVLPDNAILFPFENKRATQIINKTTGFNVHFIRHIRATNLITLYDFNEQALVNFMGWSDSRPAKYYMEFGDKSIARQFLKTKR